MVERSRVKQNNTRKRFNFYFAFLGVFFLVSEGLVGLAAEPFLEAALTGVFLGGLLVLDGVFLAAVLVAALLSFFVALDGVFLAAAFFFDFLYFFTNSVHSPWVLHTRYQPGGSLGSDFSSSTSTFSSSSLAFFGRFGFIGLTSL